MRTAQRLDALMREYVIGQTGFRIQFLAAMIANETLKSVFMHPSVVHFRIQRVVESFVTQFTFDIRHFAVTLFVFLDVVQ